MSRSRKHVPVHDFGRRQTWLKRRYNRLLRRMPLDAIPSGGSYRRLNESWEIPPERCMFVTFDEYCELEGLDPCESSSRYAYERSYLLK